MCPRSRSRRVDLGLGKNIGEDLKTGFEGLDIGVELPTFDPLAEGLDTVKLKTSEMSTAFQTAGHSIATALEPIKPTLDGMSIWG